MTEPMPTTKRGRNEPCPCGSGKKYKKCCGQRESAAAPEVLLQRARNPAQHGHSRAPESVPGHLRQLAALLKQGRFAELESYARAVIDQQPADGAAWKALAASLQMQAKDGLPAARKAAELLPSDAEAHHNLGLALLNERRPEDAIVCFRRSLALSPGYVPAQIALGSTLQSLGRIAEAVECYRGLLRSNPGFAEVHSNLGHALWQLGRAEESMMSCQRALQLNPGLAEAHSNLGNALLALGKLAEAESSYRQALAIKPGLLQAHINLAHLLRRQLRLEEAADCYRRVLQLNPRIVESHVGLAHTLVDMGRLNEALSSYHHALELNPRLADVHNSLGDALRRNGQPQAAVESCLRALQINPGLAAAHSNLGNALLGLGRAEEAEASYRRALSIEPDRAEVHSNLAKLLLDVGRTEESIASARRAVELAPRLAAAHENLANALLNVNFEEAVRHYRVVLASSPNDAEVHNRLGTALRLLGRTDEGEASIRKALELTPGYAPAMAALAEARADRGEFEAAEELFKQALASQPDLSDAWLGLSRLRRFTPADADWLAQAERLARQSKSPREIAALDYAIGKYYDDIGEYDRAFTSYQRANEISRRHARTYDRQEVTRQIDELIDGHERPVAPVPGATGTERPILIVGMPRSGTSLVEQILSSHPAVFGAGELTYWHSVSAALRRKSGSDDAAIREAGAGYERLLAQISGNAARVVDKMPTNFLELGLIHRAVPGARIIHMQRDPIDTCLSIYFQDFRSTLAYANHLDDLAHFYREYGRLMHHWRRVMPEGAMLDVPYESLVEDQEGWTRRMLEFIDLPWNERCMDFHQTQRSVVTASKWQVRQRISRSSVARWRHYEAHITPLLALPGLLQAQAARSDS